MKRSRFAYTRRNLGGTLGIGSTSATPETTDATSLHVIAEFVSQPASYPSVIASLRGEGLAPRSAGREQAPYGRLNRSGGTASCRLIFTQSLERTPGR